MRVDQPPVSAAVHQVIDLTLKYQIILKVYNTQFCSLFQKKNVKKIFFLIPGAKVAIKLQVQPVVGSKIKFAEKLNRSAEIKTTPFFLSVSTNKRFKRQKKYFFENPMVIAEKV